MAILNLTREQLREIRDEAIHLRKRWEKMASGTPSESPFHDYARVWAEIEAKAQKALIEQ